LFCFHKYLSGNIRQESHKSGALDRRGQQTLVFGSHARPFVRHNPGMRIQKLFEHHYIFIVNVFYVIFAKVTLLGIHKVKIKVYKV
jgi:hypothetical protein